jgi:hypothetical protein
MFVCFPKDDKRRNLSRITDSYSVEDCVGYIDGTHVVLSTRPHIGGEFYFNRKGRYPIHLQITCDDRGLIKWLYLGWRGSVFDSTAFDQPRPAPIMTCITIKEYLNNNPKERKRTIGSLSPKVKKLVKLPDIKEFDGKTGRQCLQPHIWVPTNPPTTRIMN